MDVYEINLHLEVASLGFRRLSRSEVLGFRRQWESLYSFYRLYVHMHVPRTP